MRDLHRPMRKALFFLLLAACGPESFTLDDPRKLTKPVDASSSETNSSDDAAATDDASAGDAGQDAKPDVGDAALADASPDAACTSGSTACMDVWNTYCARLKMCCAGQCSDSWANNGGNDCALHFFGYSNYCALNRSNDKRCVETCMGDVQGASCTAIKSVSSGAGVSQISSACLAYWQ